MKDIVRYYGSYRGVVKDTNDPLQQRRLRVAVPQTTGYETTGWAWPKDPSGVHTEVPPVGQGVWVSYQGGDPEYPVWEGAFGTNQASNKYLYLKPLSNSESVSDVTDLLKVNSKVDGTSEVDVTDTLLNVVRNRYYGVFLNTGTQTTGSANIENKVLLDTTLESNGITNSNGTLTVAHAGVYTATFSMQLTNHDTQSHDAKVWAKLNGSNVANSASVITVPGTHGGDNGQTILTVNFVLTIPANGTLELWGGANNTNVRLETLAANAVVPIGPVSPSVILTVAKVR